MKILFTRFPLESRLGGAERQTIALMEGLLARGHAVAFAGSCPTLLRLCKEHRIPAVEWHIGKPPVTPWLALSFFWRRFVMERKLRKLMVQFQDVDAVCMLSLSEKLLLTDIAAKQKKKIFWIEHDRIGNWLRQNPWLGLLKRQSRSARIVTVSDMSKELIMQLGFDESRITAIPNGIDANRLAGSEQTTSREFTVGCVARLTKDKGINVLLEAMRYVPHAQLTVVGSGPERAALGRAAGDNVMFFDTHPDLGSFYRSVDVLVLPSTDNDPFGMVAAEAMHCGTPVIVTDQCGIAGYLRDGSDALIVRANDADALARALLRMTDSGVRAAIAERGSKTATKRFSVDTMIDTYERLLG